MRSCGGAFQSPRLHCLEGVQAASSLPDLHRNSHQNRAARAGGDFQSAEIPRRSRLPGRGRRGRAARWHLRGGRRISHGNQGHPAIETADRLLCMTLMEEQIFRVSGIRNEAENKRKGKTSPSETNICPKASAAAD